MGLSTIYANIILFVLVLGLLYVLMTEFSDYFRQTTPEVKNQADYLTERVGTSVALASMTTNGNDVIFYVVNDGKTTLNLNCTDFYLDRTWVKRSDFIELTVLNTTFDPGLWNPGEWAKMRTQYPTGDGLPHEGKIVTCNGVSDSMVFYKTA
jgi:archaellum component FlaF (FlaF/FlaG flagellin family)